MRGGCLAPPPQEPCMPIKLSLSSTEPLSIAADILFVGIPEGASTKNGILGELVHRLGPAVAKILKREDFTGKKDQTVEIPCTDQVKPTRLLLVGLGKEAVGAVEVRLLAAKAARFALGAKAGSLALEVPVVAGAPGAAERAAAEGVVLGAYRFTKYLTGDRLPKLELDKVTLLVAGKVTKEAKNAATVGQQVGEAICMARDLINEPPNELYPATLAAAAVAMCKSRGLSVTVLDRPALEKKGMKLIVAVGRGSRRDPRLIHMTYKPARGVAKKKLV